MRRSDITTHVPAPNTRSRVISFRILEAEYQDLMQVSTRANVRTLSDLARYAVCSLIDGETGAKQQTGSDRLTAEVNALASSVRLLNTSLTELIYRLTAGSHGGPTSS